MMCSVVQCRADVRALLSCALIVPALHLATPDILPAQQTIAATESIAFEKHAQKHAQEIFSRPVSVQLSKVSPADAVHAIASNAKVRIQYRLPLLDVVRAPVSLSVEQMPLKDALQMMLAGSGLRVQVSGENLVTIMSGRHEAVPVQGTIVGKVVSAKTKRPVVGAIITVTNDTSRAVTGVDGTFRITLDAGSYEIRVRGVGFVQQVRQVTVEDGKSQTVEFVLAPSASVLDEVVVTGTVVATERKAITTPITVITGDDLEQRGITRIEQLFRGEVPGLLVLDQGTDVYSSKAADQSMRSAVYARGSADLTGGANPIKTYVDGVELLDPAYLGTIDPRSIERIEIITGPQAATIYGSGAMGGVMQIFTKKGNHNRTPEVRLSLRYGILQNNYSNGMTPEHHDVLTLTGGTGPEFSYSGSLSYDYRGQWQPKLFSRRIGASLGVTHTNGPLTATASMSTTSSRNGTYSAGGDYGMLFINTLGCNTSSSCSQNSAAQYYSDQISTSSNQTASFNGDYRLMEHWQHHITMGRSQNIMALHPVAPNFTDAADTLFEVRRLNGQRTSWNYNTSYSVTASWLTSTFTLGSSGSVGDQTSVLGGQRTVTSSSIIGWRADQPPRIDIPIRNKSLGAFAQSQIGLFKQFYATLGLRFEQNPDYGTEVVWDVTPTHGFAYTIEYQDLSVKLLGSYGQATRPPGGEMRLEQSNIRLNYTPSFYLYQFANPELRPERSRGPQAGLEVYYGNRVALTVNHYSQTVDDLIQGVPVDSIELTNLVSNSKMWVMQTQNLNVAKVRQFGWEGTGSLAISAFTFRGTYTWSDSRVVSVHSRGFGAVFQPGETFGYVPSHMGYMSVSYAHGPTTVMLSANYVGSRHERRADDQRYWEIYLGREGMYTSIAPNRRSILRSTIGSIPGYTKSNLVASHHLTPQLSMTVNITNVGNSYLSDTNDLNPSLGRQTTFGLAYRFGRR